MKMKILFFVYPSAFQSPGGGEIFLLKSKEALENKGIEIKLFNQWEDRLKDYDILHVFGSVKECLPLMEAAKCANIKVALSPIYWSTLQRSMHEYGSFASKTISSLRHLGKVCFPGFVSARRKMMEIADLLLPNSEAESWQVCRLFGIKREKMHIVPLGADGHFLKAERSEFIAKYGIDDFILSVGRIEPRKNQLNLIKAMKNSPKKLVLIGEPVIGYQDYYEECRRLGGKNTIFLSRIDHDSMLLASAYAACSAFVLPAWFETPGLAALEAGLAGAKIAVTKYGSTCEYFKEYAQYFNPGNPREIKQAIERTLGQEKSAGLKTHILKNYLWENTACETIKAYNRLLES